MSDKDPRNQLEGFFSDIVPGFKPEEAAVGPAEAEAQAKPEVAEPTVIAEAPPPALIKPEEIERPEIPPPSVLDWEATLRKQRTRIMNILLGSLTGIGAIAIIGLLIGLTQRPSRLGAYIPYFAAYMVLVGLMLGRRLNPALRATALVIIAYIVGVFSLLRNGPLGTGGLYLLIAPLMLSIFVRRRASLIAAAVSVIIYIAFVIAHYQGWLQPAAVFDLTQVYFVLILGGTFAMVIVCAMFIQWMFNSALTNALQEAGKKHAEVVRSRTLLEERAGELANANALLRKLTLQLQTAAHVSRAATSMLALDELVHQVVNLIRERFDLYYVGLFLIDESGQWAVLQAGTGEAGRRMLAQGNRLKVGDVSMVGWCTAHAQTRIAPDVGEQAVHSDGLLPETRSEMVLPLISRGRMIGALDTRSTKHQAFSKEDITALQTLADQVGVAIDNARLYQQTNEMVRSLQTLNADLQLEIAERRRVEEELRQHRDHLEDLVEERTAELMKAFVQLEQENTERKRAEEALREAHERLNATLNALPDLLFEVDRHGRIYDFRAPRPELLYASPQEFLGQTISQIIPQETASIIIDAIEQAVETGRHIGTVYPLETPAGPGWFELSIAAKNDPKSPEGRLIVLVRDVTERKRAEEELRKHRDHLEELVAERTAELVGANERLRRLARQVISAQEEERQRLSRELHDEAGQALTALKISQELIQADLPAGSGSLSQRLAEVIALTDVMMEQIRLLAQDLRPPTLDAVGLNPTLEGFCRDFARRTQLSIDYLGAELPVLPEAVNICLYRFLQEALTNVAKYARANQVRVVLSYDAATVHLSVEDDGQGFDKQAVLSFSGRPMGAGIGLLGMQERLDLLGGWLEIESHPGQGTRLAAHIPCEGVK